MEETLKVLNQMVEEGVIGQYAIGGAVAAAYYVEPIQTEDLDIFLLLPTLPSGLISTTSIYAYLMQKGYEPQGEAIRIGEWPVQFLPVHNPLTEEALANAVPALFEVTGTYVISAEYLAAIMLQVGRPKDMVRLLQFLEFEAVQIDTLEEVILRHHLETQWQSFRQKFLTSN